MWVMNKDILLKLLADPTTFKTIATEFPGLYAACVSIKQNINPDQVTKAIEKIKTFYANNDGFKKRINDFVKANFVNEIETDIPHTNHTIESDYTIESNSVAGMVFVIDKNEESYKDLITKSKKEKWMYRGISIIDDGFNNLRLYFY
jgi:hypothetical protein